MGIGSGGVVVAGSCGALDTIYLFLLFHCFSCTFQLHFIDLLIIYLNNILKNSVVFDLSV